MKRYIGVPSPWAKNVLLESSQHTILGCAFSVIKLFPSKTETTQEGHFQKEICSHTIFSASLVLMPPAALQIFLIVVSMFLLWKFAIKNGHRPRHSLWLECGEFCLPQHIKRGGDGGRGGLNAHTCPAERGQVWLHSEMQHACHHIFSGQPQPREAQELIAVVWQV